MNFFADIFNKVYNKLWKHSETESIKRDPKQALFFSYLETLKPNEFIYLLTNVVRESSITDAILLVFYIRDIQYGKSNRELGRLGFNWLLTHYPDKFQHVFKEIPKYGRWDDLVYLFPSVDDRDNVDNLYLDKKEMLQHKIVGFVSEQLIIDYNNMWSNILSKSLKTTVSQCALDIPSERSSYNKKYGTTNTLCYEMGITPRILRKKFISPLRKYLRVVNNFTLSGWNDLCMQFNHQNPNPNSLGVYERSYFNNVNSLLCWDISSLDNIEKSLDIEEHIRNSHVFSDTIIAIDTTIDIDNTEGLTSFYLAIMTSSLCEGVYNNKLIDISNEPKFIDINTEESIKEQILKLSVNNSDYEMSIDSIYNLLLSNCIEREIDPVDIPNRLFVICNTELNTELLENTLSELDEKFREKGYTRPLLVYWNINLTEQRSTMIDYLNLSGTTLLHGFSYNCLEYILNIDNLEPSNIIDKTFSSMKFNTLKMLLS